MPKKIVLWSEPTVFNQDVTELIEKYYGCMPIKLSQNDPEDLKVLLDLAKKSGGGVLLAGGNDISNVTLGNQAEHGDGLTRFDLDRDKRELFTINYCFENDIPMGLFCRGFQIMLAAQYGLPFLQDISNHPIVHAPHDIKFNFERGEYPHWISCFPQFHEEFFERGWCVSQHHQALHFSGKSYKEGFYASRGVEVIGIADLNLETGDKKRSIIELARGMHERWIGTQSHPEAQGDYLRNPAAKKIVDCFGQMIGL